MRRMNFIRYAFDESDEREEIFMDEPLIPQEKAGQESAFRQTAAPGQSLPPRSNSYPVPPCPIHPASAANAGECMGRSAQSTVPAGSATGELRRLFPGAPSMGRQWENPQGRRRDSRLNGACRAGQAPSLRPVRGSGLFNRAGAL